MNSQERAQWIRYGEAVYKELFVRLWNQDQLKHQSIDAAGAAMPSRVSSFELPDKFITLLEKHKVYGTLEEVADLYLSKDKAMVLDFSESRNILALHEPTPDAAMTAMNLRWSLFKSPNRQLARDQDFCYIETMKPFVGASGRRGWAKASHSVDHPLFPDFSRTRGINRGQVFICGQVFQETSTPGELDATFYYNVDTRHIPRMIVSVVMKARGKNNAALLNHYLTLSRKIGGDHSGRLHTSLAVQLRNERRCGACSNRLPKFKRKESCHFCRVYLCTNCCLIVSRNYRMEKAAPELHFCFSCAHEHGRKIGGEDVEASAVSTNSESPVNSPRRDVKQPPAPERRRGNSRVHSPQYQEVIRSVSHANANTPRSVRSGSTPILPRKKSAAYMQTPAAAAADPPQPAATLCDLSYLSAFKS